MILTVDYETRSRADLKKVGAWNYAEHESTQAICFASKPRGEKALLWVRPEYADIARTIGCELLSKEDVFELVLSADEVHAHNAHFELAVWNLCSDWGGRPLDPAKVYCTMAQAARCSMPLGLEAAGAAMGLPIQKDADGHRTMLQLCKPRKKTGAWWEAPEKLEKLFRYCIRDVEAEEVLSEALPPLPAAERTIWLTDYEINKRGVKADIDACELLATGVKQYAAELNRKLEEKTNGHAKSATQIAALQEWLVAHGIRTKSLDKAHIKRLLAKKSLPDNVREVLEIRREAGKTSTAKFSGMVRRADPNHGVIRGTTQYHAAGTGRWGGRGIQPQNFPRDSYLDPTDAITAFNHGLDVVEMIWGVPTFVASRCLRGCLTARPGNKLVGGDYSAVEGRVGAWVAGEQWVLDAYREYDAGRGSELYCITAQHVYGRPIDKKSDPAERMIGKVADLALGYQGWLGAFHSMADGYGIQISDDEAKRIILTWRARHPMFVHLWKKLEECAVLAVENPGHRYAYRNCLFTVRDKFLLLRLPNGRALYYYDPEIFVNDRGKKAVSYMSVDQKTHKWVRKGGYGGLWTNNIVQGLSRDIEARAIVLCERDGLPVVIHTHDEVVADVPMDVPASRLVSCMLNKSAWAKDIPLAVGAWEGFRYRKD